MWKYLFPKVIVLFRTFLLLLLFSVNCLYVIPLESWLIDRLCLIWCCIWVPNRWQNIACMIPFVSVGVDLRTFTDLFWNFTPHLPIVSHRHARRLNGAQGYIWYLQFVHNFLRVIDIHILAISFEILTVLCINLLFRSNFLATMGGDRLNSDLNSLVFRLIISCICNVTTISLTYNSTGIWLIRFCLDRSDLVAKTRHEAKFLLVT